MSKKIDCTKMLTLPAKAYKEFMQSGETLKWHMKDKKIEGNPELTTFINDLGLEDPNFLMTLTGKNNTLSAYVDLSENRGLQLFRGRGLLSFDSARPGANIDIIIGEEIGELPAFKLNAMYKTNKGFDVRNAELKISTDSNSNAYDIRGTLLSNGNEIEIAANTQKLNKINQRTGVIEKLGFGEQFTGFDGIFNFIDKKINEPIRNFTQNILNKYDEI